MEAWKKAVLQTFWMRSKEQVYKSGEELLYGVVQGSPGAGKLGVAFVQTIGDSVMVVPE